MDFKTAEDVVKKIFLRCFEKEANLWGVGEAPDLNGFFLSFYRAPIEHKIKKIDPMMTVQM